MSRLLFGLLIALKLHRWLSSLLLRGSPVVLFLFAICRSFLGALQDPPLLSTLCFKRKELQEFSRYIQVKPPESSLFFPLYIFSRVRVRPCTVSKTRKQLPKAMGFSEVSSRTMAIETSMKSSAFGFLLAKLHFGSFEARVPSAISVVWMAITGSMMAIIWRYIPVETPKFDRGVKDRFEKVSSFSCCLFVRNAVACLLVWCRACFVGS